MFRMFDFCFFFFFDLFRRIDFCRGCIVVFSMSRMLKNEMVLVFLVFLNLIFKLSKLLNFGLNFRKSRISLCYGVPYIVSILFTF